MVTARVALGWHPQNLVFMGMGEPLDDYAATLRAVDALTDRRGLGYAADKITICTAGPSKGLAALAASGRKRLGLAVSLHGADDAKRSALMPINRKDGGLAGLQASLVAYPRRSNTVISLNW